MTRAQATRYVAIQILAIAASGTGETLDEIAEAIGIDRAAPVHLARRTLADAVGVGNWRETRAEAAARLRSVAREVERERWTLRSASERARWKVRAPQVNAQRRKAHRLRRAA